MWVESNVNEDSEDMKKNEDRILKLPSRLVKNSDLDPLINFLFKSHFKMDKLKKDKN